MILYQQAVQQIQQGTPISHVIINAAASVFAAVLATGGFYKIWMLCKKPSYKNEILSEIRSLRETVEEIRNDIENEKKRRIYATEGNRQIRLSSDTILRLRKDAIDNDIKGLLLAGLDVTLELFSTISNAYFDNKLADWTEDSLKNELDIHFDKLKISSELHIGEMFADYIKENSDVKHKMSLLVYELIKIKDGTYNGKSETVLKEQFIKFLESMYMIGIDSYKSFIKN